MTPKLGTHVALASPDSRGRFNLKRWLHPRPADWRVYVQNDGKTIILEQVEGAP